MRWLTSRRAHSAPVPYAFAPPRESCRELDVRFVDKETSAAREGDRISTASVVGDEPRRHSRRHERRLGELRPASRCVGADLDHGLAPKAAVFAQRWHVLGPGRLAERPECGADHP
jgi:hypothetical protein